MGKPSSNNISRKSSTTNSSSSCQKIHAPLSVHKMDMIKRERYNKTKNKIKNLFNNLKRQSMSTSEPAQDVTVISLDTTEQNDKTVIDKNIPATTSQKRTRETTPNRSTKRKKSDNSLIVVSDDDNSIHKIDCPMHPHYDRIAHIDCSTPINKRDSKTLRSMIINNFNTNNDEVINLTKEIHRDSYLTIDLTSDSEATKGKNQTVIDVDKPLDTTQPECTLVSISNASLSMSGDSDVTVLHKMSEKDQMNKFKKGIAQLNTSQKEKLLELITNNIFNGCKLEKNKKFSTSKAEDEVKNQGTETEQDTFIKEVILGEAKSRNSVGSNIYHPSKDTKNKEGLRMIVIDGSNVAMAHTKGNVFSVKGLKICIDYFVRRGHVVKAFVPRFRCKFGKSSDPKLLDVLERQGLVVYTPSREIQGRICVPYDDRYIVQCAAEFDGVIVSGDYYRDLLKENPRWRFVIENRVLPFTWVNDMIMFPKDPMGRNGPTLDEFLKHSTPIGPTILL